MGIFVCKRCGYECTQQFMLRRHLERKLSCIALVEDIAIDDLKMLLVQPIPVIKHHKCKYCDKIFSDPSNRYRHQKICKQGQDSQIENLKETVSALQQQILDMQEHLHSTTNIHNTTYNISLNNFGNESYHHISDDFIKQCIMSNVSGIQSLIERIHFSDDAPENKNVRIKSLKNNLFEVANNTKWIVTDANDAMEIMIDKSHKLLNKYYLNPDTGLMEQDINTLDAYIQTFLLNIMDKSNKHYFALRRRILALIIQQSKM